MSKYDRDRHIATEWFLESGASELNLCEDCPAWRRTFHDCRRPPLEPDEYDCPAHEDIADERCRYYAPVIKDILDTLDDIDVMMYEAKKNARS